MELPFIFYSVPDTNPDGPVTVFCDRFWDFRENWLPEGVGLVPGTLQPYFGPVPDATVGVLEGTPTQWIAGFNYDDWIAGRLGGTCWPIRPGIVRAKVRQKQTISDRSTIPATVTQKQQIGAFPFVFDTIDQVQTVQGPLGRAGLDQVQTVVPPGPATGTACVRLTKTPFITYGIAVPVQSDGDCDCSLIAGIYEVSPLIACSWIGDPFAFCGYGDPGVRWVVSVPTGSTCRVQLVTAVGGVVLAAWQGAVWTGENTIFCGLISGNTDCDWTDPVTVFPIS